MSNIALKVYWQNEPMSLNRKIDKAAIHVPFGVMITHPTGSVKSVNGKVGDVVLNAADVGADAAGSAEAVQQNLNTEVDTLNSQLDSLLTDLNNLSGTVETKASAASVLQALSTKADLINGVIPAAQLPSFVDDVLEYESWNQFPSVGEAGKIYVDTTENKTWRWSGSTYVIIGGGGVALGETAATAYRGDRGKAAYDHSISQGNSHNATTSDIPEGNKLYFTEDRVLQAALIGLNTTNPAPVTATDALLAAIGKLQAQINNVGSGGITWVDVTTIAGTAMPSVGVTLDLTRTKIYLAKKDGQLWVKGYFQLASNISSSSIGVVFRITDPNWFVDADHNIQAFPASFILYHPISISAICFIQLSVSQMDFIVRGNASSNTWTYSIPPTCIGKAK